MFRLLLEPLFILAVSGQEVTCSALNGDIGDKTTWVPCNKLGLQQSGVFSSCCILDGPNESRDACDKSGLCIDSEGKYRTGLCTDKTWNSKACVQECVNEEAGANVSSMEFLTPCDWNTSTFCCGKDDRSCCNTDRAARIATEESVCTPSTADSDTNDSNKWAFKPSAIGIGVAVGLIVMVEALSAQWLWRQNRWMKLQIVEASETSPSTELRALMQNCDKLQPDLSHD
ncbi:hypothetical protein GCG54_00012840 [Colletotrichum gloeosporioides]|uniref:Uncharacterized protein n=1 Tax=Colletotrichum gloeosporioides TaxID=474922 RepID=A0A8H4FPH4_COLGL|nr:uncharacterized protein GCG54_00012840 [Colletotrichum gloeosporioides]KAF3809556.1 hypothetical protein GCG54_00012840 [Colletotrichum gloeosporioides]